LGENPAGHTAGARELVAPYAVLLEIGACKLSRRSLLARPAIANARLKLLGTLTVNVVWGDLIDIEDDRSDLGVMLEIVANDASEDDIRELDWARAVAEFRVQTNLAALAQHLVRSEKVVVNRDFFGVVHEERQETSNDPSSATRRAGRVDCNRDAPAGFAAAHG
jgi:hypothetical protein